MSYRGLKRVLGETNLERKILLLFGGCLTVMLCISFYWVDRIGEGLVMRTTQRKGRDWTQMALAQIHWEHWNTTQEEHLRQAQNQLGSHLRPRDLKFEIISERLNLQPLVLPLNEEERRIMAQLEAGQREQYRSAEAAAALADKNPPASDTEPPAATARNKSDLIDPLKDSFEPVFVGTISPESNRFFYYQPVYWTNHCFRCHEGMYGRYAVPAADAPALHNDPAAFMVMKITMPHDDTRAAINYTRAVLITVALLAVVLSMTGLWLVVRYVINKPLAHLRDVSDEVSRGNLSLRADIRTNDEFEELAASFNRMLRHLTDAQKELRNVNSDLDAKVDELAQLNMRLHEMNQLKSEFLANMSHELRTPLNSIIGFSDLLTNTEIPIEKRRKFAQNIQKSGRDLLDMINDILDLAKMEAGKMDVKLSEFRIDAVIAAQCDLVRSLAEQKNIDLRAEIEEALPPLFQDQSKVQQILTNLLSNAIKFTPEGGRIAVGARGDGSGNIEIYVSDTGVGISEIDREIIFEKFRQGTGVHGQTRDNLTREYSGTGLGLSIVKELCRLLGGEIAVESELGKGSTFRVILPWMRTELAQPRLTSRGSDAA